MKQRSWRLGTQLVVAFVVLVSTVVFVTAAYFINQQTDGMRSEIASRRTALREELRKRGMSIARNVALSSERAVATLDFLFLTEILDTTLKNDGEFVYGIIMNNERLAQVHTDPSLAGKVLDDPNDRFAAEQTQASSQERDYRGKRVLEAIAPVLINDSKWGVIRLGVSTAKLDAQMRLAEDAIAAQFEENVTRVVVFAAILLLFGIVFGTWLARRLSGPLQSLVASANRIRDGELGTAAALEGALEFRTLGSAFNEMARAIQERDTALRENNARLKEALDRAQEVARLKSEFLSNVSHELRTPLNSIVNIPIALLRQLENSPVWLCDSCGTSFAREGAEDTAPACANCQGTTKATMQVVCTGDLGEHRHFLQRMRQSSQHLLGVVNDLLDFSKLEAGKMRLSLEDFDAGDVLTDAIDTVSGLASDKGVTLTSVATDQALQVHADRLKVTQVLINLLGNAIKFTPAGGTVSMHCEAVERNGAPWLHLQVRDTGVGIPAGQLEAIFESFRQVDGSHTRQKGGTGLGLSITRQLVHLHGGNVWAESEPGHGSVFHIMLPRLTSEGAATSASHNLWNNDRGSVMVIDDSAAQLELTKLVLEQDGFSTTLIESSKDAVEQVKERKPKAIILDIMMPDVNGITILKQLKSASDTRDIPVFVATAYHQNRELVESLGGIWMPKPWDAKQLVHAIRQENRS